MRTDSQHSPAAPRQPPSEISVSVTPSQNRRRDPKTSRACDRCKAKKTRCTGTFPCQKCSRRGISCTYDSRYARGRLPTPQPSITVNQNFGRDPHRETISLAESTQVADVDGPFPNPDEARERVSPELEIEGQYFDPTSGLTFLHRAWRKVFSQRGETALHGSNDAEKHQLLTSAGDRAFYIDVQESEPVPDATTAKTLLSFYFDACVVTYRMLHRGTVERWLAILLDDRAQDQPFCHSLGNAKLAVIFTILAIARFRKEKIHGECLAEEEATALRESDRMFCAAMKLTDNETGFPRLESVQARLIQVLYLLQTSRMNKAWYTFGNAFHIIYSLGLHRRRDHRRNIPPKANSDYISSQCCKRTFWVAYIIDKYLSVVFGRPQLFQDHDISQEYPDSINDEDMTSQGPSSSDASEDCHNKALLTDNRISQIISRVSREVYSIGDIPDSERLAAANLLVGKLHEWSASLPLHLGTVKPSTLVPSFRREAAALKLAYLHAVIHTNRPFMFADSTSSDDSTNLNNSVSECISAAKGVLELVNRMANDNHLFHSFWWTHYATFCALAVVYVWEIQRSRSSACQEESDMPLSGLLDLAERCRSHLFRAASAASPSRRYDIILDELRQEAQRHGRLNHSQAPVQTACNPPGPEAAASNSESLSHIDNGFDEIPNQIDAWQTTDWLDLDSSISMIRRHHGCPQSYKDHKILAFFRLFK